MNFGHLCNSIFGSLPVSRSFRTVLHQPQTQSVAPITRFAFALVCAFLLTYPFAASVSAETTIDLFLPLITSEPAAPQNEPPVLTDGCQSVNDFEMGLADSITNSPDQQRSFLVCNPILATVARQRARDMAVRNYFGHTNPDGNGPNTLVRNAGYPLPGFYNTDQDGNNIESIAAGYPTAEAAFEGWMNSSGHRTHVLGEIDFYREQVEFGVGYYYNANSDYKHYWVFLSAYEE